MGGYPRLRVLRYMGSKYDLVDFVVPIVEEVAAGRGVADVMAGTHAIGFALRDRLRVFANDVQFYSYVVGRALLEGPVAVDRGRLGEALSRARRRATTGWFETVYADTYLSRAQCRALDTVRLAIAALPAPARYTALTALLYAMCYCQSTPGHFAQFLPAHHPRAQPLRALDLEDAFWTKLVELEAVPPALTRHCVTCLPAEELALPPWAGVAYLDPPYTSEQYSRFYHLLETAALGDLPAVRYRGRYRHGRFRSQFSSRPRARTALARVLGAVANARADLALSYSDRGLVPVDELGALVGAFYRHTEVHAHPCTHSSLGKGRSPVSEYVVVGRGPRLNTSR